MRYCLLASGSNGNACYVESGPVRMLIDVGIGPITLSRRLATVGRKPADVTHVLLTHEHTDHVSGLAGLLKRNPEVRIYASRGTLRALHPDVRRNTVQLSSRRSLELDGVTVFAFRTSHDCAQPVGYRLETPDGVLGYATDLGMFGRAVVDALTGCNGLVVEANHCPEMLRLGPYPPFLKERVASRRGHLSNVQSRRLLEQVVHSNLAHVTLAHLSDTNNCPEAVLDAMGELTGSTSAQWWLGSRRKALPPVEVENGLARIDRPEQTELKFGGR